jgi:flagellar assembly factor FliW
VKTGAVKNAILVFEYLKKLVLIKTHKIQLFKHASEADHLGLKKG